jgi:hypothetical protein
MPGDSITKKWTYIQKWTYIGRKQNIHLMKKQHISQNFTVQLQLTEYKLQNTEKQQDTKNKERATAGNLTRAVKPIAQPYRLSYPDPVSSSLHFTPKSSLRLASLHLTPIPMSYN